MQPLPEMTLEQACELANRISTIELGVIDMLEELAGAARVDFKIGQLITHAATAYKALLVVFAHALELEKAAAPRQQLIEQMGARLEQMARAVSLACFDEVHGPVVREAIERHLTQSDHLTLEDRCITPENPPRDRPMGAESAPETPNSPK